MKKVFYRSVYPVLEVETPEEEKAFVSFAKAYDNWETEHFRAMRRIEKHLDFGSFLDRGGFDAQDKAGDIAVKKYNRLVKMGRIKTPLAKEISDIDTVDVRLMVNSRIED